MNLPPNQTDIRKPSMNPSAGQFNLSSSKKTPGAPPKKAVAPKNPTLKVLRPMARSVYARDPTVEELAMEAWNDSVHRLGSNDEAVKEFIAKHLSNK
jgi:hypothetical protein